MSAMYQRRPNSRKVTLKLQDDSGRSWAVRLSADCEVFIGLYPRLPEFRQGAGWLTYS